MNYSKNLGKRISDFSNIKIYSSKNGIIGQCVWYVRCRALEKLGKNTGIIGNANTWFSSALSKKLSTGSLPKSDSIACFNSGSYGHVIYVEYVSGNTVYYTEANSNSDNKLSFDDGILKKTSVSAFISRKGYQGCIYLTHSEILKTMTVKAKDGLNYRNDCKVSKNTLCGTLSNGSSVNVVNGWSKKADGYNWSKIKIGTKYYYCVSNWLK